MLPGTTLEQWLVLQTVVEEGSHARAAERLARSQSSVSYALAALQDRLGLRLLEIVGRRAELTEAGRLMLAQAKPLLQGFRELESRAASLRAGVRPTIGLVVDSVLPRALLLGALRAFQTAWPQVQVHVAEVLRTESERSLAQREAELYLITQPAEGGAPGGEFLLDIEFVALARADHPLHALEGPLTAAQLARHPLVMIADRVVQRTQLRGERELWSFTTIEAAVEAVCQGVGYGWLPRDRVAGRLAQGELRALPLAEGAVRHTALHLVLADAGLQYDPAVAALAACLRAQAALRAPGRADPLPEGAV